ncbi:ATP-binding protein [Cellulophaga sp. BC115SP]|uniref:HD domain-containing protein n=1 Tax=Cellulophaga sp. BC115SP TaxID=2683263 RepID=UPI001412BCCE|nr:ATP-binding protein [Cellulophaga sp. BC115SP]NBB31808.1 hypothetical protein [Cellulophaga sp. BC115SP]
MEHLNSYYTIEKHLEETAKVNPTFKVLDSIWQLNKRNLSTALANVNQYYPHYSLHEKSHSNTIVSNIESFLGEERIKKLSPTNAWLILMASFTHDLGMVVFQDLVEKEWESDDFQTFLKEISEWEDEAMSESGNILLQIQELSKNNSNEIKWLSNLTPIKVKNALTLAVAEYIRRVHHKRSADILRGADKLFYDVAKAFYSDQIPQRLMNILGEVAYLHGVDFYEIFSKLDYESNGISSDKINPRFVASLLRLGDLLDVDDKRFNSFTDKVFKSPQTTKFHQQKHSSIRHLLITPENIEITADCPNEEVYRLTRNWFDWLEEEVEKQGKEWSNIAPSDLGGSAPRIGKGKIKVYYNNSLTDDNLLNLRFQVSNNKIFEILEGSSIYEKAEFTFIRELVQNALDASKIQLWTEIENGTFDFVFHSHFGEKKLSNAQIIEKIKFPTDIPESLVESFEVKLSVNWTDESKTAIVFTVEDNGTGISNSDLLRMTSKVGESRKKNKLYTNMLGRIPFWLKPTGAFGLGLQSVFIVSDTFIVQTKSEGEESKEIIFRSAKKGKYSSITNHKPTMGRGTKVIVQIPQAKFPQVFGRSFNWDVIMNYDYFTDEHKSIYIPKIQNYIYEILKYINTLQVDFFDKNLFKTIKEKEKLEYQKAEISEDQKIQCRLALKDKNLYFEYYERVIGSEFVLCFHADTKIDIDNNWATYQTKFLVRDIPVEDKTISYYKLKYARLIWNFMSPESDKILSLTREKFITKNKSEIEKKFLDSIVPKAIELAESTLLESKDKVLSHFKEERYSLAYDYFKLLLSKSINGIKGQNMDSDFIGEFTLPRELITNWDDNPVKIIDFFNAKNFIVSKFEKKYFQETQTNKIKKLLKDEANYSDTETLIVWNNDFFSKYLLYKYNIKEIYFYVEGLVLVLTEETESIEVKSGIDLYFKNLFGNSGLMKRGLYYAVNEYKEQLSVENSYASGFEIFPFLSNLSIISPFRDLDEYKTFKFRIEHSTDISNRMNVENILTDSLLSEYISDTLIDWVIENKPKGSNPRDRRSVLDGYKNLIIDALMSDISSTTSNDETIT